MGEKDWPQGLSMRLRTAISLLTPRRWWEVEPALPEYSIDVERRLVSVKFGSSITAGTIEAYTAALRVDPAFQPEFSELIDLCGVKRLKIEAEDALKLADYVDPFSKTAKRAFVAHSGAQVHAARMHQLLCDSNIRIFESVDAAMAWIAASQA